MTWKDEIKKADREELLDLVQDIAELIYMQAPLKAQDAWLKEVIDKGIYKP